MDGTYYFIVNNTANDFDETVVLRNTASTVLRMDPLNGQINSLMHHQQNNSTALRLQLKSGHPIPVYTAGRRSYKLAKQ